jgi:OOP family OmpA-OmpF porin
LKEMRGAVVEIIGFTDNQECSGSECQALSLRRAQVVYDWLVAHGVSPNNLRAPVGRGSDLAIDSNDTELGRQRNRRTEVHILGSAG